MLCIEENNLISSKNFEQKMIDIVSYIDSKNAKQIVYIFNLILIECLF